MKNNILIRFFFEILTIGVRRMSKPLRVVWLILVGIMLVDFVLSYVNKMAHIITLFVFVAWALVMLRFLLRDIAAHEKRHKEEQEMKKRQQEEQAAIQQALAEIPMDSNETI